MNSKTKEPETIFSSEEIEYFLKFGFVKLVEAFPRVVAFDCREKIFDDLSKIGFTEDPSTWEVERVGIKKMFGKSDGYPWSAVFTHRFEAAIDELVGKENVISITTQDRWREFRLGWWTITFPQVLPPPWEVTGNLHVDGSHFTHYPDSPDIGLIAVILFGDTVSHGGGTALVSGSHRTASQILWDRPKGISGPILSRKVKSAMGSIESCNVVETTGNAGDVMFMHPLLLHARSKNLGSRDAASIRIICTPSIPLNVKMNFKGNSDMSPVEKVMWEAFNSSRKRKLNSDICLSDSDDGNHLLKKIMGFSSFRGQKKS